MFTIDISTPSLGQDLWPVFFVFFVFFGGKTLFLWEQPKAMGEGRKH